MNLFKAYAAADLAAMIMKAASSTASWESQIGLTTRAGMALLSRVLKKSRSAPGS